MLDRIRDIMGLTPRLEGLELILNDVAAGRRSTQDAARQIRRLAAQQHMPPARTFKVTKYVGILFAAVGLAFGGYSLSFQFGTAEVRGTVVEFVGNSPVVKYEVSGRSFTHRSPISSSQPDFVVGEMVPVLYRLRDPESAQINTFLERWFFAAVFTACGVVWTCVCLFVPRLFEPAGSDVSTNTSDSP